MRPLIAFLVVLSLSGCALPAAGWAAIGAMAGACATACAPFVGFERDVFDYAVEGEKDPQPSAPAAP